jgi:hypothetical protein
MRRFAPEVYDSGFRVKPGMTMVFGGFRAFSVLSVLKEVLTARANDDSPLRYRPTMLAPGESAKQAPGAAFRRFDLPARARIFFRHLSPGSKSG